MSVVLVLFWVFLFHPFPFQHHQDEQGYHGSQENGGVKVRSLEKVICCKDQEYDQEDKDAGELEDIFFEGHDISLCFL